MQYNYQVRMVHRDSQVAMAILMGKLQRLTVCGLAIMAASSVVAVMVWGLFMAARLGSTFACN